MNRFPLFALLVFPGLALACGDISSYRVDNLEFQRLPVDQAVAHAIKDTPFKASYKGVLPTRLIDANNVSGPLDKVLPALAGQFGMVYAQNGCELSFISREARVFTLASDDMINDRLGAWLALNGYALSWEAGKYRAGAGVSIDRPFEDVLKEVASIMKGNGVNLAIEIYANHMVRVTEVK